MYLTSEEKEKKRLYWENINVNRELIKLCKDLTIEDWRIIRGGNYWQIRDKLTDIEQKQFIRNCIQSYIKKK
jgi:hypothetical protein